jgi:LysM repeat protein
MAIKPMSCDDGLYKDLALKKQIGVNLSSATPTTTRVTTVTSAQITSFSRIVYSNHPDPPAHTQSGIAKTCTKYYKTVLDDGCWAVANSNGITLDRLYAQNPAGES